METTTIECGNARDTCTSSAEPLVTIAVPSFNQGRYLDAALESIFEQNVPIEVFLADGGSTDNSLSVVKKWEDRLAGWRSRPDAGQAAAINECIALGKAPFVCWLNSDDWFLKGGLHRLLRAANEHPEAPGVYGRVVNKRRSRKTSVQVEPFDVRRLAVRCIISQPGTLIRRTAWTKIGGLDEHLSMAMDYDLWWRLYLELGPMIYIDHAVAVNRDHPYSKTNRNRRLHYKEAMTVVRRYNGRLPLKWWLAQPYSVWLRGLWGWCHR